MNEFTILLMKVFSLIIGFGYTPRIISAILGRHSVSDVQIWTVAICWTNFIMLQWLI